MHRESHGGRCTRSTERPPWCGGPIADSAPNVHVTSRPRAPISEYAGRDALADGRRAVQEVASEMLRDQPGKNADDDL